MASMEELMLIFRAKDEVSSVTGQIDNEIQSMASSAQAALASMTSGMASISTVSDNLIGSLNNGKSASELIFGTASKAETNKVLVNNMTQTKEAAEELYSTVDKVTDSSLTSMQDLIPALNAFKAATGASDEEIKDITDDMANFGAAVLAQTGSTALAETAMMSLSKGIKGAFAALDQYGVSEDALKRTGKWSGDEKDVRGFMDAVTEVMGSTEALMETNQGLDALIQKAFSRGGKKIGNEFLPVIKDVKRAFIDLDNELGGNLTAGILVAGEGIDIMNSALFNVSTAVRGFQDLKDGVKGLAGWVKGIAGIGDAAKETTDAVKGMSDALSSVSNAGEMGANLTSMGAAGAGAVEAGKNASKGEKAVEAGGDALLAADMLKSTKSESRDLDKLSKELKELGNKKSLIAEEMDYLSEIGSPKGKLSGTELFDDALFAGMEKFGAKGNKKAMQQYSDVLLENMTSPIQTIEDLVKSNDGARKEAGKLLEELSPASTMLDDDTLKLWEKSEMTATEAIKNHMSGFKSKLSGAFSSVKEFVTEGFGTKLQKALQTGFSGIGDAFRGMSSKFSNIKSTISSISFGDIKGAILKPFNTLATSIKGIPGKIKGIGSSLNKGLGQAITSFSFTDTIGGLKDKISGLRKVSDVADEAKDVGKGMEALGDVAGAAGAAAPAIEAGAAGAEGAAAATTTLSGAFTSMIVPALALAAVVAIMIPIVAGLAAEAMIFIKLLGEFMQSLHFENIDLKGSIDGLKQIAEALLYVGAAMAAMTFTGIMTGLAVIIGGFTGITGPLKVAVGALKEAATELKAFETVTIDPSVGEHLKTISDSLTSVSSAMLSLTSVTITTGFSNFIAWAFKFGDTTSALEQAKNDIMQASSKLNEFSGLTPLDQGVAQNIQNVCNSIKSVGDAMGALRSIRDSQNWDTLVGDFLGGIFGGQNIQQALDAVKTDIQQAASALQSWTGLPEIPQDLGDKVGKVSSALQSISDAFNNLRSMRDNGNWDAMMGGIFGGTDIQGTLNTVINELQTAANAIKNINVDGVDDAKIEGLTKISSAITKVSEVATTLSTMPPITTTFDPATITTAITTIQNAATELGKLSTITFGEGGDPATMLGTINTAITTLRDTLTNLAGGFAAPATNIGSQIVSGVQAGLSPLQGTVQGAVSSAVSGATGAASSGGQNLGRAITDGFKSTLKLADAMNTEMGYLKSAVDNGVSAAVSAAQSGGKQVVEAFKSGINSGSPGDIYRAMKAEMGYTNQAITDAYGPLNTSAEGAGRTIVEGFGNPALNVATPMNPTQLQNIGQLTTPVSTPTSANSTTIVFQEGAMPIDARNMTMKEAKQMLILALESLDLYDPNPGVA